MRTGRGVVRAVRGAMRTVRAVMRTVGAVVRAVRGVRTAIGPQAFGLLHVLQTDELPDVDGAVVRQPVVCGVQIHYRHFTPQQRQELKIKRCINIKF